MMLNFKTEINVIDYIENRLDEKIDSKINHYIENRLDEKIDSKINQLKAELNKTA